MSELPISNIEKKNVINSISKVRGESSFKPVSISDQLFKKVGSIIEIKTDNYLFIIAISLTIVILAIIYLFSKPFRVSKTLSMLQIYNSYQALTSYDYQLGGSNTLANMRIASSYNASHIGYQMFDYTSEEMIIGVLQCGARYLEFNIYNSDFSTAAYPVVSMGYRVGEWKLCLTDLPFDTCANTIAENAFTVLDNSGIGVPNPDDPIFIGLVLNTNSNLACLNTLADILLKYFGKRFIDPRFSYQNTNEIGEITMSDLMGRVVIFSSDGYQGSKLEEIVNYCWDNVNNDSDHRLQRIHMSYFTDPSFNGDNLIKYNETGITIVVPHKEGDIFTTNYDAVNALDFGCQFAAINFQIIDAYMDQYITIFKDKSIVEKRITSN